MMKDFLDTQLIGVIIGGILGFGSSLFFYNKQYRNEIGNITNGYYIEICFLEKQLDGWANIAKTMNKPFKIENGIYTNGLYFQSPTDIFKLNSETASLLFEFYNSLIQIDKNNNIKDTTMFNATHNVTRTILIRLNDELLPKIKQKLKNGK